MSHRYQTRFQVKLQKERDLVAAKAKRAAADEAEVLQCVLYVKGILHRMERGTDFCEKAADAILLFEHLYEVPLLLESYEKFRQTVWDKMNELEATILRKLQAMPAKSAQHGVAATTEYEMRARLLSFNLLHLMESVRVAFW
jgi:hypothetical protein